MTVGEALALTPGDLLVVGLNQEEPIYCFLVWEVRQPSWSSQEHIFGLDSRTGLSSMTIWFATRYTYKVFRRNSDATSA